MNIVPLQPLLTKNQPGFTEVIPLGLYIHIPWCIHKCPYCDFNSHKVIDPLPESVYVDALIADLEHELPRIWGRSIDTIFIGGGTPSLFSAQSIEKLISQLRARLRFSPETEITLEANPGTIEAEKFSGFYEAGINRLSIGIQSFDNQTLQDLGRIHNSEQATHAFELARNAGFNNINLDLMFGLPKQTVAMAKNDLQTAIELQPEHISYYQLTIEPNTLFHHHPPVLANDDLLWEMQEHGKNLLADHGYTQYEISAYARPERSCKHNINYWQFGDYLGIGAGAHSKLTEPHKQSIVRMAKARDPQQYIINTNSPSYIQSEKQLTATEVALEFMMNALRLTGGFETSLFSTRTGLPISVLQTELKTAVKKGLIEKESYHIRPTALGNRFLNNLLELFVPM